MRLGVMTGGGDAPGLNAAVGAVVFRCHQRGHEVCGILDGGGAGRRGEDLPLSLVRDILPRAGTILGTSRANPLDALPDGRDTVLRALTGHGIDALIAIGGDAR